MPPRTRHDTGSRSGVLQRMRSVLSELWVLKTPLVILVTLTAALPLPLLVEGKESRCAYVLLVMAMLWLTEALPIPVTALLPVFMFPMAGIVTAKDIGHSYFSNTSMLFIGGLVVAIGVEECNLHKRLALTVLRRVGADPKWIMLGLMLPTWFLSMWISNTATASMMIPIVEAVLQQIRQASDDVGDDDEDKTPADLEIVNGGEDNAFLKVKVEDNLYPKVKDERSNGNNNMQIHLYPGKLGSDGNGCQDSVTLEKRSRSKGYDLSDLKGTEDDLETATTTTKTSNRHQQLAKGLSLSIAYAANVGGIATITGTPPNLVLKGQVDQLFAKYGVDRSPLTFPEWMAFGFPLALLLLVLCWLWLVAVFLKGCCHKQNERQKQAVKETIQREYKALGSITFAEVETLVLFIFLALIWISRDPKVVPGWNVLFEETWVTDFSTWDTCVAPL